MPAREREMAGLVIVMKIVATALLVGLVVASFGLRPSTAGAPAASSQPMAVKVCLFPIL